jgi:hypothetical protein
MVNSMEIA